MGLRDRIPHLDTPQSSDPVSLAFAPLFAAPERHPGGPYTMPPIPREARTRAASFERQNYIVCRCELILVDWIDRFAYTGLCGAHDLQTFERATMILWRLTSIRKSLDAKAADPTAPDDSAQLDADLHNVLTDLASLGSPHAPSTQPAPPSPIPGTADSPVRNSVPADQPASSSPENPQSAIRNPQSANPQSPCIPPASVRAVPACPTLSPQRLETFLARTQSDIASLIPGSADALVRNSALAHQPASSSANASAAPSSNALDDLADDLDSDLDEDFNDDPDDDDLDDDDPDLNSDSVSSDPFKPMPCGGDCLTCLQNQTCEACTVANPPDMNDPPERDALLRWSRRRKRAP